MPTFCNCQELNHTAPGINGHSFEMGFETLFALKELREEFLSLSHMLYDNLTDCHVHLLVVVDKESDRVEHALPCC